MSEKWIEQYLVREVESIGGECPKWVSPGNAGVPDRLVLLPRGEIYFVELKSPLGALTPLQHRWGKLLRNLGFTCCVLASTKDVDKFIRIIKGDS